MPTGTLHAYKYLNSPLDPFKRSQSIIKDNIKNRQVLFGVQDTGYILLRELKVPRILPMAHERKLIRVGKEIEFRSQVRN